MMENDWYRNFVLRSHESHNQLVWAARPAQLMSLNLAQVLTHSRVAWARTHSGSKKLCSTVHVLVLYSIALWSHRTRTLYTVQSGYTRTPVCLCTSAVHRL